MANFPKTCGNCCHSCLHVPIKDKDAHPMLCLFFKEVVLSNETNCNYFQCQTKVDFFHTWDERNLKPNKLKYEHNIPFE